MLLEPSLTRACRYPQSTPVVSCALAPPRPPRAPSHRPVSSSSCVRCHRRSARTRSPAGSGCTTEWGRHAHRTAARDRASHRVDRRRARALGRRRRCTRQRSVAGIAGRAAGSTRSTPSPRVGREQLRRARLRRLCPPSETALRAAGEKTLLRDGGGTPQSCHGLGVSRVSGDKRRGGARRALASISNYATGHHWYAFLPHGPRTLRRGSGRATAGAHIDPLTPLWALASRSCTW